MAMHLCFSMRIKPTTSYENILICYIIIALNLLHMLVTISGYWFCCLSNISLVKYLQEDGHKRWSKHVGCLQRLWF